MPGDLRIGTVPSVWTRGVIDNCTICGTKDRLITQCPKCHKYACDDKFCAKLIKKAQLCFLTILEPTN